MRTLRAGSISAALLLGLAATAHGQLAIVNNRPGTFDDISGTGTELILDGEDFVEIVTTIDNPVFPAGRVVIGNNGGLGYDPPSTLLTNVNGPIPNDDAYVRGRAPLPYWDNIGNGIGRVYWEERANDVLIVQWHNKRLADTASSTVRFQIKVFDGSASPYCQFLYDDVLQPGGTGSSATIGFQSGLTAGPDINDVQWSFNEENAVENGTVLSLVDAQPIPVVSPWGLLVLALLLLAAAAIVIRRLHRPTASVA